MAIIVNTSPLLNADVGEAADVLRATGYTTLTQHYDPARPVHEIAHLLGPAAAAIVSMDCLNDAVFQHTPHLRVIARTGVGYDAIDVEAATARDIVVCASVGSNDRSVAELTWALILSLARRVPQQFAHVQGGGWQRTFDMELAGKTLGIIGFGAIGQAVARRGRAFEMSVLAFDSVPNNLAASDLGVTLCTMETVLQQSDVVSVHVSLTPASRRLIDAAAFAQMRPTALFINTSRGPVVDETALLAALERGSLAGVALDVMEKEPPGEMARRLLRFPQVIITPHCAGTTRESVARAARIAADNVARVLRGEYPLSAVNPIVCERLGLRRDRL